MTLYDEYRKAHPIAAEPSEFRDIIEAEVRRALEWMRGRDKVGEFAKLYGSGEDQILVMIQRGEDGDPEVRVFFNTGHPDLGTCSTALGFDDTDSGWDKAEKAFSEMNGDMARALKSFFMKNLHLGVEVKE